MVKLLGSLLIMGACGLMGLGVARNYALRPRHIRALQWGLKMLETEIQYASTPLPLALRRVARGVDPAVSSLFARAAGLMVDGDPLPASQAWEGALEEFSRSTALCPEDLEVLARFGQYLGISEKAEQIKNLQLAKQQLAQQEVKAEGVKSRQEPLWRTMGFVVGLTLAIVLY